MTVHELTAVFGKNIKRYRISFGLSQEQLAEKMDLSTNTICEIEKGKKFVRADTLAGFAVLFKTEVYELFKPDNFKPDNASGVLVRYSEEVQKATEKIKKKYLGIH